MQESSIIQIVEELSMNAWPALQTLLYDGWVLRFAKGYTRRANSVNPLYSSTRESEPKIKFCEELYRRKSLNTVFKMTPQSTPAELDGVLAAQGYQADAHTSVQLVDLTAWMEAETSGPEVNLAEDLRESWLAAYCRMSSAQVENKATHEEILRTILPQKGFASIMVEDQIIACGLGVLQDGFIGLYDIVTDPAFRRQGYGLRLVKVLLTWGQRQGAQHSYLQVMLNNPPALALYAKLGYREAYRYWYRVKQ